MPLPSTQDMDARFTVFLNPIRDLTKNWEVDIAKYMEDYLEELAEVRITFDGGETMMNFAEAAMLIQGSATVYSKKVEFLWQMVLQMLDLLSSKRKLDTETSGGAEAVGSGGAKGKGSQADETVDFQRLDNIGEGKNITLKEDEDEDDLDEFGRKKQFAFMPATPLHLVEKESEKGKNRVNLFLLNMETLGGKDDFRVNRSYMTPWGLLCLDLPPELLQKGYTPPAPQATAIQDGGDLLPPVVSPPLGYLPSPPPSPPPPSPPHDDFPDDMGGMEIDLPPLPVQEEVVVKVEQEEQNKEKSIISEPVDIKRQAMRHRAAGEQVADASAFRLTEPLQPVDPHQNTAPPRPMRAGRIRRPPPCSCHTTPPQQEKSRKRKKDPEAKPPDQLQPIDQHILKHLPDLITNNTKCVVVLVRVDMHPALRDQFLTEEVARTELLKRCRASVILAEGMCQTIEEAVEVEQERDMAQQNGVLEEEEDEGGGGDVADGDDFITETPFEPPDPHTGLLEDEGGGAGRGMRHNVSTGDALNDTLQYEPNGEYEALVQKWVADYIIYSQDYIASSDLTRRVNKWRSKISPILTLEEERQSFDIHSYGSRILDAFGSSAPGAVVTFQDVVDDLPRKEVARMFLSSLMLTNTYNVEPVLADDGDLAMDCLSLRLLTRVRHHEEMQEYVAPSQHTVCPAAPAGDGARRQAGHTVKRRAKPTKSKGKSMNKRPMTPTTSESDSSSDGDSYIPSTGHSSSRRRSRGGDTAPNGAMNGIIEGLGHGAVCADITEAVNRHVPQNRMHKKAKGSVRGVDR